MHPSENLWKILLVVSGIAVAALAAYHNTFSVPLLLDDEKAIRANPSIRHLVAPGSVLLPPDSVITAGRPLLNLSLALNYSLGGVSVTGYHAFNLVVHMLAGITLFGFVRRTLRLAGLRQKFGDAALLLAFAIGLVWTLHPIQTESVTYVSQRAESMMGLCYLLTLYFFLRAAESPAARLWPVLTVTACALGMMTKEAMVSAPVIVLMYDRAFVAGSFREALRRRGWIHLGLGTTWLVLAALMAASSGRLAGGAGYGTAFSWWTYALTESKAVITYLKLLLWPDPLVFDYGPDLMIDRAAEAAPYLVLLLLLLTLTGVAWRRWPGLGFLGMWFFLILAPTSSIVPVIHQPMAESRLYLPSAAIVALVILGLYSAVGRKGLLISLPAIAITLGFLTFRRNADYRDEISIWSDTISKFPNNSRAHNNLGKALAAVPGRLPDAISQFEAALKINPGYAEANDNLGSALARLPGRLPDAISFYEAALRSNPRDAEAQNNLGVAYTRMPGRLPDAIARFESALRINPDFAEAHNNLGNVLGGVPGRLPDAIAQYESAVRINPEYAEAHYNLGVTLENATDRLPDAISHFETALRINPDFAEAHFNLGNALLRAGGRSQEARSQFEAALRLRPDWEPMLAPLLTAQP